MEVAHLAGLIKLPVATVEGKLGQMILDKKLAGGWPHHGICVVVPPLPCQLQRAVAKLSVLELAPLADSIPCVHCSRPALPCPALAPPAGTLDQGVGTLEVFEEAAPDAVYPGALETFDNLARVVESLAARSAKIATATA